MPHRILVRKEEMWSDMGISGKVKKTLEKKFSGNPALNKEALRWRKALNDVNQTLSGAGTKTAEETEKK